MINPRVDASTGLDGEPVVLACFDLDGPDVAAVAHAVMAVSAERYRVPSLSTDEVLELRELTALVDELTSLTALQEGLRTLVMRPARLTACSDALAAYVEVRDEAEWIRDEDREPLARVRPLLPGLEDLCADALRAARAAREPTA